MAKISVIIPVLNGAGTLRRLCDSILAQSYADFQVMIIDNASDDGTEEIARKYAELDQRFIYCRNHKNMGFTFSYMRGYYSSMDCDYLAYISAGDYLHQDYFKGCVEALEADPQSVLAYSYCQFVDDNGNHVGEPYGDNFNMAGQGPEDRYLTILSRLGLCTAFYGLIRMKAYIELYTFFSVTSAALDNVMLAALAFKGHFIEIKNAFLFRRADMERLNENYLERQKRVHKMAGGIYRFSSFLFYHHILAHLGIIQGVKEGQDLNNLSKLYLKTLEVFKARYQTQLENDAAIFAEAVIKGHIFTSTDDEHNEKFTGLKNRAIGDYPILDAHILSELSSLLECFYWLNASLKPKNIHLARALLYIWQGRREEALGALDMELANNPTSLHALEIKNKLKQIIT